MISNHFPTVTYGYTFHGQNYGWVVLSGMVLVAWCVAAFVRRLG